MNCFHKVIEISSELQKLAFNYKTQHQHHGSHHPLKGRKTQSPWEKVQGLLQRLAWVDKQYDELQQEFSLLKMKEMRRIDEDSNEEEHLRNEIISCKDELYEVTAQEEQTRLLLNRVRLQESLMQVMQPTQVVDPLDEAILKQIDARDKLILQCQTLQKRQQEIIHERQKVQRENMELRNATQSLREELSEQFLQQYDVTSGSQQVLVGEDMEYQRTTQENRKLRTILLQLILGSSLDWAQDPSLEQLLFTLEDESIPFTEYTEKPPSLT